MGLKQSPMKPKGAFPLTQGALDQAQHLFGPHCTQPSQFILYPFLGLSLQYYPYFSYLWLLLAMLSTTLRKRPSLPPWQPSPQHSMATGVASTPHDSSKVTISPSSLFMFPGHPFKLPSFSCSFFPTKDRAGCVTCQIVNLIKNQHKKQIESCKSLSEEEQAL